MIHTSITRNYLVFLLPRLQTRSAIYGSQIFDSHKWPTVLVRKVKESHAILRHICVDHCILLLKHLSNHMHFVTNGQKHFSKTNSTDPRQRVPLRLTPWDVRSGHPLDQKETDIRILPMMLYHIRLIDALHIDAHTEEQLICQTKVV